MRSNRRKVSTLLCVLLIGASLPGAGCTQRQWAAVGEAVAVTGLVALYVAAAAAGASCGGSVSWGDCHSKCWR